MNKLKTDIAVLGNHEFDYGDEELLDRIEESEFPWLGSNVRDKLSRRKAAEEDSDGDGSEFPIFGQLKDVVIREFPIQKVFRSENEGHWEDITPDPKKEKEEKQRPEAEMNSQTEQSTKEDRLDENGLPRFVRVGFTGVCTRSTPYTSNPSPNVVFEDPIQHLKRTLKYLRSGPKRCDVVVAVTHVIAAEDRRIAMSVPGIDVILGGHDHSVMIFMQGPKRQTQRKSEKEEEESKRSGEDAESGGQGGEQEEYTSADKECLIFKTGQNATWLGVVDLRVVFHLQEEGISGQGGKNGKKDGKKVRRSLRTEVYPSWKMLHNFDVCQDPEIITLADSFLPKGPTLPKGFPEQLTELEQSFLLSGRPLVRISPKGGDFSTKTDLLRRGSGFSGQVLADAMLWYWKDRLGQMDFYKHPFMEAFLRRRRQVKRDARNASNAAPADREKPLLNSSQDHQDHHDYDASYGIVEVDSPINPCMGLINGGYIRGDILYQAGNSSLGWPAIQKELPFQPPTVLVRIKGRYLRRALFEMLGPQPGQTPVGSTPQFSRGMTGKFRPALIARMKQKLANHKNSSSGGMDEDADIVPDLEPEPADAELTEEEVEMRKIVSACIPEFRLLGREVQEDRLYDVVTSSFIARGGDGCLSWKKGKVLGEEPLLSAAVLAKYFLRMSRSTYDPFSETEEHAATLEGVDPAELKYIAQEKPKDLVVTGEMHFAPCPNE